MIKYYTLYCNLFKTILILGLCFSSSASLLLYAQADSLVVDSLLAGLSLAVSDSTLQLRLKSAHKMLGAPLNSDPATNRRIREHVMGITTDTDIIGLLYIRQIQAHSALDEIDSAIVNIHKLHDFSIKASGGNHEDGSWYFDGLVPLYMKKGWYEKTIFLADSMVQVPGLLEYTKFQMYSYKVTAYSNLGDYPAALSAARESLADLPEGEDRDFYRLSTITQLISLNQLNGDLLASRRWLTEGLSIPETPMVKYNLRTLNTTKAELLLAEGKARESRAALEGSFLLKEAFETSYDDNNVFINMHIRHVGVPSLVCYIRTFLEVGELNSPELRRSINRAEYSIENNLEYIISSPRLTILAVLADYYSLKGDHEKALTYAQQQLEEANALENYRNTSQDALKTLHGVQARAGMASEAYSTLNQYQEQTDSIRTRLQNFQTARAAAEIELDEYARAREAAERATIAEREAAALKSRYFTLALLGGAIVLGILAWAYRRSRRDQQLIKEQNLLVTQSLGEKEVLLREIHHRVKNNLQIISSLLQKQGRLANDVDAQKLAKEGQERIQSMALIHENLYQSEQLSGVNIKSYLEDLGANIGRSHQKEGTDIKLDLVVADEYLDLDTAIPVGLILNELLTNAYKYAFPNGGSGQIQVIFQRIADHFELEVNDNGVGLPPDHAARSNQSLGHNLVKGLVRQLDGTLKWISPEKGTHIHIKF